MGHMIAPLHHMAPISVLASPPLYRSSSHFPFLNLFKEGCCRHSHHGRHGQRCSAGRLPLVRPASRYRAQGHYYAALVSARSAFNAATTAGPFAGAAVPSKSVACSCRVFGFKQAGSSMLLYPVRCRYFARPHMPAFHLSWLAFFAGEHSADD